MVTLTLFHNNSSNNTVSKVLSNPLAIGGTFKDATEIVNPQILLEKNIDTDIYNYVYISELHRYYYIIGKSIVRNGIIMIDCKSDPLKSFEAYIRSNAAIIDKAQNAGNANKYINDGSYVNTNRTFTKVINFDNGFNDNGEFLLITAGGV